MSQRDSWWTQVDSWLWPEEPVPRTEKATQHITPNICFSNNFMFWYRMVACALMWAQLIFVTWTDFKYYGSPQASYFSLFGIYLGTIVFTLLAVAHCVKPPTSTEIISDSPWHLWKWCNFLLPLHFHWQFLITSLYWLVLYWDLQDSLATQPECV